MYNVTCLPVLIISGSRTGSTILAHDIKDEIEQQGGTVQVFNEPINSHEWDNFLNCKNKNYILKVHAHDLKLYPTYILDMIKEHSCFLVRIRRRSIEDQVLSYTVALKTNGWGYYNNQSSNEQHVVVSDSMISLSSIQIKKNIELVKSWNKELDTIDANFDLDLFYEDLDLKSEHLIKSPKPNNHSEIREIIRGLL